MEPYRYRPSPADSAPTLSTARETDRRLLFLLVWAFAQGLFLFFIGWLADPPSAFFYLDLALAAVLGLFGWLVLAVLDLRWPKLQATKSAMSLVLLSNSFRAKRWSITLYFLGGQVAVHVGWVIGRWVNGNDISALIFGLPAAALILGGGAMLLFGVKSLIEVVSATLSPSIEQFLDTAKGKSTFWITGSGMFCILVCWALTGAFRLGLLMFSALVLLAGLGLGLGLFGEWLRDSESTPTANGNHMKDNSVTTSRQVLTTVPDLFDESRILADLQRIRDNPSLLGQYFGALRSRFTGRQEIDLINQWTDRYKAGGHLIQAKTGLMRAATEYRGQELENQQKAAESEATIAKHHSDKEEHVTRGVEAQAKRKRYEVGEEQTRQPGPTILPEHTERFARYQSERVVDGQEEFFDSVFLPTMTAIQLEKAFEKQKTTINRDRELTEDQKDRLVAILTSRYQKSMQGLKGSGDSVYEES